MRLLMLADPLISTWASNTMGRTPEKRAVSVAFVNVLGQVGNIIAPASLTFQHTDILLFMPLICS